MCFLGCAFSFMYKWFEFRPLRPQMVHFSSPKPTDGSSFEVNDHKTPGHFFRKVEGRTIYGNGHAIQGCPLRKTALHKDALHKNTLHMAVLHKDSLHKQEHFMYRGKSVAGL